MTRQQLYELVWAEPISKLAERYGMSDRGFAKMCARANVPVPERGYWARLQAGQTAAKPPLPAPTSATLQHVTIRPPAPRLLKIGRASCRERVCQYVYISVVAVSLKKKTNKNT